MNETTWKKEPAIEGKHGGCLNCGPRPSFFPPGGVSGTDTHQKEVMSNRRFDKLSRQLLNDYAYGLRIAAWIILLAWAVSLATCA